MKNYKDFLKRTSPLVLVALGALHQVADSAEPGESVVTIYGYPKSGSSQGTGFVIGDKGYIATAYHVIQDSERIEILDHSKKIHKELFVEWIDADRDLAIISVAGAVSLPPFSMAPSIPGQTDDARIAGSPRGLPSQILTGKFTSKGYVSSLSLSTSSGKPVFAKDIKVLPIDVTIYGGMSGAPVLSADGGVTGVLSGSYDEGRGIGWAIPVMYVSQLMSQPPMHKRLDQIGIWPALNLMSANWVSLKRSYSKRFTSLHLARLESLEGALRDLRGSWSGTSVSKETVYDGPLGNCRKIERSEATLTVESLDLDQAQLVGVHRVSTWISAEFTDRPQSFDTDDMRDSRREMCYQSVTGERTESEERISLSGPIYLKGPTSSGRNDDQLTLPSVVDVTDCQANDCPAGIYGKHAISDVEVISKDKIRWLQAILTR